SGVVQVTGDIIVSKGAALTILPGTSALMDAHTSPDLEAPVPP
ncbi:unnamed protein product, partial [marine sediment metagenome]